MKCQNNSSKIWVRDLAMLTLLMENMQNEDTDDEDEPDFDVDHDLHE